MTKIPRFDGKRLIKLLGRHGFTVVRIKGSHHFLQHADGRVTVVPVHAKETIGAGLFHKILKDCELSTDQLLDQI
ncbi:MAG: type II toxin-antitoxin system HicA family toxin [Pyrinomonadaceae bacterium]